MLFLPAPSASNQGPQGDVAVAIFIGIAAFIMSVALLLFPVFKLLNLSDTKAAYYTVVNNFFPVNQAVYKNIQYLEPATLIVIVLSMLIGAAAFYCFLQSDTPDKEIALEGRKMLKGVDAIKMWKKVMSKEELWGKAGILLCQTPTGEELTISQDRETKHVLIVGASGSGKTTILRPRIDAARSRGDRCLIFDNKSDYTATLPNSRDIILVAPWDARGWAWDVAVDCRNKSDAQALANAIVEESKEPMWSNSARAILTALIVRCQKESPAVWGFSNLTELMKSDKEIQRSVQLYTPEFSILVLDMESKTVTSYLVTLIAYMMPIFTLADAWDRCAVAGRFSIKNWLHETGLEAERKTLIIQGNGAEEGLQKMLTQSLIYSIKREVTSPRFTDVAPHERRINLFLDEFKQLGKLEGFGTLIEVGRSKGIRLTIVLQDIQQLFELYGKEVAQTWLSNFGTYVIGKLSGVDTTKWLSDTVGKKRIRVFSASYSNDGVNVGSRTDSYQEQDRAVIQPEEFSRLLGVHETGVRVALFTNDDYLYIVDSVSLTHEQTKPKRLHTVPANWTKSEWPSAHDVAIAEQVVSDREKAGE